MSYGSFHFKFLFIRHVIFRFIVQIFNFRERFNFFAFNFNNFNLIFLLTGGGPRDTLNGDIAGATDILISYTYQIAFGSNVQDLGLASAISFVIFLIVASISLVGLKRSKVMENFL